MSTIPFHTDAQADLADIRAVNNKAASRILAVLEQAAADPVILDRLTQHDFGVAGTADFHVSRWESQQNKYKRNLWRLKVWDLEQHGIQYRVIYAFNPIKRRHYVLGITPRGAFDYADDDPYTKRIVDTYDRHFRRP